MDALPHTERHPNGCLLRRRSDGRWFNDYWSVWVNKKLVPSHRYVYEKTKGPIPDGLVVDHACGNPGCVEPSHLDAVTQAENLARGASQRASPKRLERQGHIIRVSRRTARRIRALGRGGESYDDTLARILPDPAGASP